MGRGETTTRFRQKRSQMFTLALHISMAGYVEPCQVKLQTHKRFHA